MSNIIFDIGFVDLATNAEFTPTTALIYVALTGTYHKATLTDPNNGFVSLANPVGCYNSGARCRFAVPLSAGQPNPPAVDIYGMVNGIWFVKTGVKPGNPTEVRLNSELKEQVLILPFSINDATAAVEFNTGFNFPVGALIACPFVLRVTTAQSGKTINVGLLSSETGGNASGFVAGASLAATGNVKTTINGASPTTGALCLVVSQAGSTYVNESAMINTTATTLSYTLSTGTTLAEGLMVIPYTQVS